MFVARRFEKRLTEVYVYPEICKYQDAIADPGAYMVFLGDAPSPDGFMIYVHIPFCETLCYFCNYHKVPLKKDAYAERQQLFNRYITEIEAYARTPYLAGRPVRAVQFGGGTPSAVEPEFIAQVLDAIRQHFTCRLELVTMEGSVTSLRDRDKLRALKAAGVRRLSFGVQTLNERVRRKLRLAATVQDVHDTVDAIEAVGFDDYSHDLMFNLPDQTMADVERDLHVVDEQIRPTYLDCYNLNVMPNTMFSEALQKTTYTERPPEDGQEIAMMRAIVQQTADMGYRQVMSNVFSKRRDRCVLTLEMQLDGTESIGIGPSARGYVGGRGYRNVPDIDDYIERVDRHAFSALAGNVATADEQDERQLVMMGNFGFVKKDAVRTLERYRPQVDFLVREDYAREDAEYLRLTPEGRLWPGNVSQLFFSARQRERRSRAMLNALRYKENPYNQDRQGVSAKLYRKPVVSAASAATESRS